MDWCGGLIITGVSSSIVQFSPVQGRLQEQPPNKHWPWGGDASRPHELGGHVAKYKYLTYKKHKNYNTWQHKISLAY